MSFSCDQSDAERKDVAGLQNGRTRPSRAATRWWSCELPLRRDRHSVRAVHDAIAGSGRGLAGPSVESRWLLLAVNVGGNERLECDRRDTGGTRVAE